MKINKIPLEALLEILTDLWDSGADFIDISSEENTLGLELKDIMKITVKPDYMSEEDRFQEDDEDDDDIDDNIEIKIDYSKHNDLSTDNDKKLSDSDINDLI